MRKIRTKGNSTTCVIFYKPDARCVPCWGGQSPQPFRTGSLPNLFPCPRRASPLFASYCTSPWRSGRGPRFALFALCYLQIFSFQFKAYVYRFHARKTWRNEICNCFNQNNFFCPTRFIANPSPTVIHFTRKMKGEIIKRRAQL